MPSERQKHIQQHTDECYDTRQFSRQAVSHQQATRRFHLHGHHYFCLLLDETGANVRRGDDP